MNPHTASSSLPEVRFRYKYWIILLAITILGLFLLILSQNIVPDPITGARKVLKALSEQAATALLVGAFTAVLYEYFLRREFLNVTTAQTATICSGIANLGEEAKQRAAKIADQFAANTEQRELGVSHCYKEVDRYNFSEMIESARSLIVVMNDGRGWVGNYYQRFANRFKDPTKETTFVLLHPNSTAIDVHAHKVGSTAAGVRRKIAETNRLLKRANSGVAKLRILGHPFYTTMSVFLADDVAAITPYFLARVRRTPPVFTFENNGREGMYHRLSDDVTSLLLDAVDISEYVVEDGSKMESQANKETTAENPTEEVRSRL